MTQDVLGEGGSKAEFIAICIAQVIAHAMPATNTLENFEAEIKVAPDHLYIGIRNVWMVITEKRCGLEHVGTRRLAMVNCLDGAYSAAGSTWQKGTGAGPTADQTGRPGAGARSPRLGNGSRTRDAYAHQRVTKGGAAQPLVFMDRIHRAG